MLILSSLIFYIRLVIDFVIDFVFGLIYSGKKQVIPPISKSFLSDSAVAIAHKIRKRQLTSEEVVTAFIQRIKEVNHIINAVTDNRFEAAIEEAKKIDQDLNEKKYSETELKNKPFLGIFY